MFLIHLELKSGVPDQQWLISRWVVVQVSEFQISWFYHLEHFVSEITMPILIKETEKKKHGDHAQKMSMDSARGDTGQF